MPLRSGDWPGKGRSVEQATAAPGEVRDVERPHGDWKLQLETPNGAVVRVEVSGELLSEDDAWVKLPLVLRDGYDRLMVERG